MVRVARAGDLSCERTEDATPIIFGVILVVVKNARREQVRAHPPVQVSPFGSRKSARVDHCLPRRKVRCVESGEDKRTRDAEHYVSLPQV